VWKFDKFGRACLDGTTSTTLHIRSSGSNEINTIPQTSPKESYKYVGVHIALNGNMDAQVKDLSKKCHTMSTIFNQTHFNAKEAQLGMTTVFAPSVTYPLSVTSITPEILKKIQKPVINSVLSRLGFNRHMPRAVVYASKQHGGMGLLELSTEQGVAQAKLFFTHLQAKSYIHDTIMILLESYQIASGITTSPLVDTKHRPYLESPWLQSLQQFLRKIEGKIITPTLQVITLNRQHDHSIMHNIQDELTKSECERINACRIFLQVNLLSEICNDEGTQILPEAIMGTTDKTECPLLWQISTSSLK
jgi:hypothetical protein